MSKKQATTSVCPLEEPEAEPAAHTADIRKTAHTTETITRVMDIVVETATIQSGGATIVLTVQHDGTVSGVSILHVLLYGSYGFILLAFRVLRPPSDILIMTLDRREYRDRDKEYDRSRRPDERRRDERDRDRGRRYSRSRSRSPPRRRGDPKDAYHDRRREVRRDERRAEEASRRSPSPTRRRQ
jgi:hypothetical protein